MSSKKSQVLVVIAALLVSLPFIAEAATDQYVLEKLWEIERGEDPPYSLLDLERESVPRDLFGVRVDDRNHIYLVDNLTQKLVEIDPEGEIVFAVGQMGSGPEDIGVLGEPLFWPGFHIAQSDYSYGAKIVGYDEEGNYAGTVMLESSAMISRMWDAAGVPVAVTSSLRRNDFGGFDVQVDLVVFAPDGKELRRMSIVDKSLPPPSPDNVPTEREFELLPLVHCGADGRIYVVPDPYEYRIACYDTDLNQIWSIEKEQPPIRMTEEDRAWRKAILPGAMEPAKDYHAIDKLMPRPDSKLWVFSGGPRSERSHTRLTFDVWTPDGIDGGSVELAGFPGLLGDFAVFGDKLIWKTNDDVEVESNDIPYIGVYRIEAK